MANDEADAFPICRASYAVAGIGLSRGSVAACCNAELTGGWIIAIDRARCGGRERGTILGRGRTLCLTTPSYAAGARASHWNRGRARCLAAPSLRRLARLSYRLRVRDKRAGQAKDHDQGDGSVMVFCFLLHGTCAEIGACGAARIAHTATARRFTADNASIVRATSYNSRPGARAPGREGRERRGLIFPWRRPRSRRLDVRSDFSSKAGAVDLDQLQRAGDLDREGRAIEVEASTPARSRPASRPGAGAGLDLSSKLFTPRLRRLQAWSRTPARSLLTRRDQAARLRGRDLPTRAHNAGVVSRCQPVQET